MRICFQNSLCFFPLLVVFVVLLCCSSWQTDHVPWHVLKNLQNQIFLFTIKTTLKVVTTVAFLYLCSWQPCSFAQTMEVFTAENVVGVTSALALIVATIGVILVIFGWTFSMPLLYTGLGIMAFNFLVIGIGLLVLNIKECVKSARSQ